MNTLQLRKIIQGQIFDINQQITPLLKIKEDTKEIGGVLSILETRHPNVMAAMGIGYNIIPGMIDQMLHQYQLMIANLEDYMNGL